MPEDMKLEIAIEVSTEAWGRIHAKYGFANAKYEDFIDEVKAEVQSAIEEAERDWYREKAYARQEWEDQYYEENAYGFMQQDLIDMYRRER